MNSDDIKALAGAYSFNEPLVLSIERGCQMLLGISTKQFRSYLRIVELNWNRSNSKTGENIDRLRKLDAWPALAALVKELDQENQ